MGKIKNIREFFWPLLEKSEQSTKPSKDLNIEGKSEEILKAIYNQALKKLDAEEDRKKVVENKSTIFIGTIGIITSIVIGVTSTLIKEQNFDGFMLTMIVLLFILTIYMLRTVWFAIKAIERQAYHNVSISDLCSYEDAGFYKNIILKINETLSKNYPTTNTKVDNMTMAQEYFKRGIVVLGLFAVAILLLFVNRYGIFNSIKSWITMADVIHISFSHLIVLYSISSMLIVSVFIIFLKFRRIKKVAEKTKKKK